MVSTLSPAARHTFALWQRALALLQFPAVQMSLASLWAGVEKTFC